MMSLFSDRLQAGQQLSGSLKEYAGRHDIIVLALPRGGVPVAYSIAKTLHAALDVFLVGKLGVPGHEDLALGAISSRGVCVLRPETIALMDIPVDAIDAIAHKELREIKRRERAYHGIRPSLDIEGRVVIVVDDGLVTGATMLAAVRALRHEHPGQIIVAVPVATAESIAELEAEVDALFCLQVPEWIASVGQCYDEPGSPDDAQVIQYLQNASDWLSEGEQEVASGRLPYAPVNAPAVGPSPGV
ncbi:phosphoribosyltransferase family protein [Janthinobacterium sp. 17J80-10]|uniref:phosphoribosyltransferase n=1 Tax=Janthinobacterium sp. 17J80-10 TaxID=2497863 RepID=UPI0013E8BA99|nr:phosphoribosyltransferase family protein [Janthinobacterium sp. 17J80-10]